MRVVASSVVRFKWWNHVSLATHPPLSLAVEIDLLESFRTECTIDASKVALVEIDSRLCALRIGSNVSCRISKSGFPLQR
ncbi:hypothetical protein DFQ50_108316 [Pseudocitrobacter faecalis]|uniref:Uncharacterized protein n=1 Tax=Pseudocitrobacter faecalis TaxID=1398493 RepID=A0ABX9FS91_9ENTR|nr:hypothetical protein DFQ50_108316 [Pseudocitrobacter faecalis]